MLTAKTTFVELILQVWNVKTGKELCKLQAAASSDRKQRALSAGRKYIALFAKNGDLVLIYDLTTGQLAGKFPLLASDFCQGLAFSPDGTAIAGLFGYGNMATLQVWNAVDWRAHRQPSARQGTAASLANH